MSYKMSEMMFSRYDMDGSKWRVSDETVGPNKQEAAALGWKLVRNGRMRRYYRLSDGILMEAYSYNTCIMTRMEPDEDFPYGRLVINGTKYSITSEKHKRIIFAAFHRWRYLMPANVSDESLQGIAMSYMISSIEWKHRAETIDADTHIDGEGLREEIKMEIESAAAARQRMHIRRLVRLERIRAENAAIDAHNKALPTNVITVDFKRGTP